MIGWKRCSYTCGCLDEDACVLHPKNVALEAPEKPVQEFCRRCGAHIPPRYGEGTCGHCQPQQQKEFYEGDSGDEDDRIYCPCEDSHVSAKNCPPDCGGHEK
jgi:hypothetical protein